MPSLYQNVTFILSFKKNWLKTKQKHNWVITTHNNDQIKQVWWYTPLIPTPRELKYKDQKEELRPVLVTA